VSSLLIESYGSLPSDVRQALVQTYVLLKKKSVISSIEFVGMFICLVLVINSTRSQRLHQTLFPLLSRTTSASLKSFIKQTILTDIKLANVRSKNHKLNRAVQSVLFGMVDRGGGTGVLSHKVKGGQQAGSRVEGDGLPGEEAIWAVVLTNELWTKRIW
jgi:protein SDA1